MAIFGSSHAFLCPRKTAGRPAPLTPMTFPLTLLPPALPQKRKWLSNAALLSGPFLICMLLWVLQNVINQQLDSRWGAGRCEGGTVGAVGPSACTAGTTAGTTP